VVALNDGRGNFGTRIPFGSPTGTIRAAHAADVDGDGVSDLVAIDELGSALILRGMQNTTFGAPESLGPPNARPYAVAVHDMDRNGRPDVIVGYTKARPIVFFNDGPGRFHAVPFGDAEGIAYGFAVADLNTDGLLDIVMARSDAPNMLYFGGR
jgi:hypothetical protein